jgi:hypothetical protein
MSTSLRFFKRCRSNLPVDIKIGDVAYQEKDFLNDISLGGLSFKSKVNIEQGKVVDITIPLTYPVFQTVGKVIWSKKMNDHFNVGVKFVLPNNRPTVEAVEQVCDIEQYKKEIMEKDGKTLSSEDAAIRWLKGYIEEYKKS